MTKSGGEGPAGAPARAGPVRHAGWGFSPGARGEVFGQGADLGLGGDDEDVALGPALDAAHLFVVRVAEEDDREALLGEALRPLLRAGDDGAGGVDDLDAALRQPVDDLGPDAMGGDRDRLGGGPGGGGCGFWALAAAPGARPPGGG